jgi:cytoplasmic iron level regulating protein YaaA (DUF328/UPF0246 family)
VLIVVSPAKSLDYDTPLPTRRSTEPRLLDHAAPLVAELATRSPDELQRLMGISESLAELNFHRFQDWERPFTPENARPAVFAFSGDVAIGLDAASFTTRDLTHAQKTLRFLSGLYGVLRPLDLMAPYRLEMGTRLTTDRGRDLYAYWSPVLTDTLRADLEESPGSDVLVDLASREYFGAVETDRLGARVVSPVFLDSKGGAEPAIVAFFAKRARGAMAGWIIRNRVRSPRALRDFDLDGYRFDRERSRSDEPVFVRHH